ncbi:MAG: YigZ family protein [Bacilli bacterium]|nr:YigZ family protein [Bacilli bacterium]MDD4809008.1 YigZ family protein [Bacilli bacterium]
MRTIDKKATNEIIINKSKFIGLLYRINNEEEVKSILEQLNEEYKDATHYCYAYIISNIKRFNDDGEPSGTAGIPILNVLEKNQLDNVLGVVIRYFGGIKLGSGGLIRAYTKAITSTLDKTTIVTLNEGHKIIIEFNYDRVKIIDNLLQDIKVIKKEFKETISYTILISDENYQSIEKILLDNTLNIIIKESLFI